MARLLNSGIIPYLAADGHETFLEYHYLTSPRLYSSLQLVQINLVHESYN